jgi:uncharacterized protein YndB with AHSA1/START domain
MPVHKDPSSGRRWVEAEALIPGDPDEVWRAIATGPGISSWFVPSEVEERPGGAAVSHFAADGSMDSVGKVTVWEPPRRYVVETEEGPGAVASEWTVEAQGGGLCRVRVVHSWFASSDDWDGQFEGHTFGWAAFFRILALYLRDFSGQPCAAFQLLGFAAPPADAVRAALLGPLGLEGAGQGDTVESPPDAPRLAGRVASVGPPEYPELLIRLTGPAPGIAHLFTMEMGGAVMLSVRVFLYGETAATVATESEVAWKAWMAARFPGPG